jgi:Leucine-rich repeat (LRR) protein
MIKTKLLSLLLLLAICSCKSPILNSYTSLQNQSNTINLNKKANTDLDSLFIAIDNPKKIEVILLDSLDLKSIPKSITRFTHLKHLSVVNNPKLDLTILIEQIKNLPIEFFNLQKNDLKSLPNNLFKLKKLTDLNLAYNNLKNDTIFTQLSNIKKLSELWLDHNQLKNLPKSIGKLNQIKRLYIGHNQLKELPFELANMKKLRVLHAEYNLLDTFPKVFTKTKSLLLVHLNNNKIKKIPRSFHGNKISIKGLILDNNPISKQERIWIENEFSSFFLLSIKNN